jgi:glycosyltransferase involved in cell wall biosynthesis
MKIVQVLESSATGTLSMVCLIANRLAREGHDVHVIYSMRPDTPAELVSMFHEKVVLQHIQMKGVHVFSVLRQLRNELKRLKPDVVHLHSSFAGFLGRVATLFSLQQTPFFYSPHCISFMRTDVPLIKKLAFAGLEWLACARRCLYVACSESERDAVRAYLRQPVVVIENAVAEVRARRGGGERKAAAEFHYVATAGGIRPQKNPLLFAEIARRCRGTRMRFLWVGDGDESFKRELRDSGVEVTGWLGRAEVMSRIRDADLYLSTSSWEGMPVSVIEAMMLGRPVVVSACAGNIDVVRHMRTGVVYKNADDAVAMLTWLFDDGESRDSIAARASDEAHNRFGEDRFFRQLTAMYAS